MIDTMPTIRIMRIIIQAIRIIIAYRYSKIVAIIAETEFAAEGSISASHDVNDRAKTNIVKYLKRCFILFKVSPLTS